MMQDDYVYRLEAAADWPFVPTLAGLDAVSLASSASALKHFRVLRMTFGWRGAVRALIKIMSGRRFLCGFVSDGRLANYVWTAPHSPQFAVENDACVLGPGFTDPAQRNKGLGGAAIRNAIALGVRRGYRIYYGTIAAKNIASQRMVLRIGMTPFAIVRGGAFRKLGPGETFESPR